MTLQNKNSKQTQNELDSIENAVKEVGIRAIHPEKMEAYAESMVERLKNTLKENK